MEAFIGGKSRGMQEVLKRIEIVAQTQCAVLLCGETGTGKNRLAQRIHELSPRRPHPFVMLDGAGLNPNVVESELFGHEKGAFTGAVSQKIGRVEQAHQGTLFINEVQNLSLEVQAKLLEVVEHGIFYRMGGTAALQSDFRLVSASNVNLHKLLEAGAFREDLYYRLHQVAISVPPLRERGADILILADHFLQQFSRERDKELRLSEAAKQLLLDYSWPGNVRQLQAVLQTVALFCKGAEITPEDFPLDMRLMSVQQHAARELWSLQEVEKQHIAAILKATEGNFTRASEILKIDRTTLMRKARKHKLK